MNIQMLNLIDNLMLNNDSLNDDIISKMVTSKERVSSYEKSIRNNSPLSSPITLTYSQFEQICQQVIDHEISALSLFHQPLDFQWDQEYIDLNLPNGETTWTFEHY